MNLTAKDVEWIKLLSEPIVSLNAPVKVGEYGEDVDELGSFIEDPDPGPEEQFLEVERRERLDKYLKEFLSERSVQVIRMRYGLDDGHFKTLEEVARELGITRERVRQIEATALRRLREKFMFRGIKMEDL